MQFLHYIFTLYLCVLAVLHRTDFLIKDFVCIHIRLTVCILLSPYLIHLPIAVCEIFPAIHTAPYRVSFLSLSKPLSFYLSIFGHILGLVALTVSGWSDCSCLVAVTFLSPGSTRFLVTPDFPFLASKNSCGSFAFYGLFLLFLSVAVPQAAADYMVQSCTALLAILRLRKSVFARRHNSPFMTSNLPTHTLLESFGTAVYTLDTGIFSFPPRFTHLDRPCSV